MKPFYAIRGVLAYYTPQKAEEIGITWREPPHVYFANLNLCWKSLLAFDHNYGVLLKEHWRLSPKLKSILQKAPNLTEEERKEWATAEPRAEIAVSELDVQTAKVMQSLLRQAWKGEEVALQLIERGTGYRTPGAWDPPRLTVSASKRGVAVNAADLWSFIRVAFLLDHGASRTKVCDNPECPAPFFLAKKRNQRMCERGECTAWAQRRWALNWWNEKGRNRRRARQHNRNKTERRK